MPGNLAVVIQAKLMSQSPRMRPGKHQAAPLLKLLLHSYDDMMTTIRVVIITTKIMVTIVIFKTTTVMMITTRKND